MGGRRDIAERERQGGAFAELTRPHLDALIRTSRRLVGNAAAAEDLVQEACLKAYRSFETFQEGTNYRAWLFRIMTNTYIDLYQRRQPPATVDLDAVPAERMTDSATGGGGGRSPEILYLHKSFRRDALRAVEGLPPDVRLVVTLILIEGFSYAETASVAGCPLGTVRSRLSRGRRQLQEDLKDYGGDDGAESGGAEGGGAECSGEAPIAAVKAVE